MEAQNNENKTWVFSLFKSAPGNFSLYVAKTDGSSFLFMIWRINGHLVSEAILRKSNDWQGMNIRNRCPVQSNWTTTMLTSTAQQVFPSCQWALLAPKEVRSCVETKYRSHRDRKCVTLSMLCHSFLSRSLIPILNHSLKKSMGTPVTPSLLVDSYV